MGDPKSKYEYGLSRPGGNALCRLTKATGREHYGQGQVGESDFPVNTPVPFNIGSNSVETYTEQYEYDDIGNILKLIHQTGSGNWTRGYHYGTANNRLLKTSLPGDTVSDPGTYSATYTHDAHGNMTRMPHLSDMKWDFADQLKEVDMGGGGTAYYVYSEGNRVRKVIENGNLTKDRLYLDDINEYYREYLSGSKDFERETLHVMDSLSRNSGKRKRLATVETKTYENGSSVGTPSPVIRYNFDNHLGSACLELDTSANIISYEEYHPFGTSSYRLGDTATEVSLKRYRYAGKERDEESGLYYYGARYYAAWLCRFASVDPLKDDYPYKSTYDYAENRPLTGLDLDGFQYMDAQGLFGFAPNRERDEDSKSENLVKLELRTNLLPSSLAAAGVKDMETLKKYMLEKGLELSRTQGKGGKAGPNKLINAIDLIINQVTNKVTEENIQIAKNFSSAFLAMSLVNTAIEQDLIPQILINDQKFITNLVSYIFDGTLPSNNESDFGRIREKLILTLGNEIYSNRFSIRNEDYVRPESYEVIEPERTEWNLDSPPALLSSGYVKYSETLIDQLVKKYEEEKIPEPQYIKPN